MNNSHLPFINKRLPELRILSLIEIIWFISVKTPFNIVRALFSLLRASAADTPNNTPIEEISHFRTTSSCDMMSDSYLFHDILSLESVEKPFRLYHLPALGLTIPLIVLGTVMKLNFFKRKSQFVSHQRGGYQRRLRKKATFLKDVNSLKAIPLAYDGGLDIWCTLDCSKTSFDISTLKNDSWRSNRIPEIGLSRQISDVTAAAATSLIFHHIEHHRNR